MDLYSDVILGLSKNPPNYGEVDGALHEVKAYNSYCGDKYKLHLDYEDKAVNTSFEGHGCAVSKASTAVLMQCVEGKSWVDICDMCVRVIEFLKGDRPDVDGIDDRLQAFSVVKNYPGRYECAALCWEKMRRFSELRIAEGQTSKQRGTEPE